VVADGFRHVRQPDPKHAPESLLHIQGKLHVAAWLRALDAKDVVVERRDTQSGRVADVTAVLADGSRIAVEVQYSRLTEREWATRTADLRGGGWRPIWLWGVTPGRWLMRTPIRLTPIHQSVLRSGDDVWWIDAEQARLGEGFVERETFRELRLNPDAADHEVLLAWSAIGAHTVDGGHIEGPWSGFKRSGESVARRELLTALAGGLRLHRDSSDAKAVARHALEADRRAKRDAKIARWLAAPEPSPPWRSVDAIRLRWESAGNADNGRLWAEIAASSFAADEYIYAPPLDWHADLLAWFLSSEAAGTTPSLGEAVSFARQRWPHDPRRMPKAVAALLSRVRQQRARTAQDGMALPLDPPLRPDRAVQVTLFD
jgi:hypothetical protein